METKLSRLGARRLFPNNFAAPFLVNFAPDEPGSVDALRFKPIVTATQDPKESLLVTVIDSIRSP